MGVAMVGGIVSRWPMSTGISHSPFSLSWPVLLFLGFRSHSRTKAIDCTATAVLIRLEIIAFLLVFTAVARHSALDCVRERLNLLPVAMCQSVSGRPHIGYAKSSVEEELHM